MSALRAVSATLLLAVAGRSAVAHANEPTTPLVLTLEEQANTLWSALPTEARDPRVARLDDATAECLSRALGEARALLLRDGGARAALRGVALRLTVPRDVADRAARGEASAGLLADHVPREARSDAVHQPLGDGARGAAFYELAGDADAPGRLFLTMRLEAGCNCANGGPTADGPRFHVRARAEVTPGVARPGELRLRIGEPLYEVAASCDDCSGSRSGAAVRPVAEAARAAADPCGSVCGPLAQGLAVWQRKAVDAAARLEEIAGRLTAVQIQVEADRSELTGARARRSRARSALARVAELQARVAAAEAEVSRLRQAAQDAERIADALRRLADDTRGADGRCRAQCGARPPRPERTATAGTTVAVAGGGGLGTGALLAGGAVLAAGGAVAVVAGGGSDPTPPTGPSGPPDFSGTWQGTRTVATFVGTSNSCRRVFDETWTISQTGTALNAAATAVARDCGNQPACGSNCTIFPFPWQHMGSAEGNVARFYAYSELQTPSCILPLTLQGTTLRGTMPACDTGGGALLSMDVVLQRAR